jgi:hypothetical protein
MQPDRDMHDLALRHRCASICLVAAAAGGCAADDPDIAAAARDCVIDGERLHYSVSGGLTGRGNGAAVCVDLEDGTTNQQRVDRSTLRATLTPEELADLRRLVVDANFAALQPAYRGPGADFYVHKLAVSLDTRRYTVTIDELATPPAPLGAVLDAVTEMIRTPPQ